MKIEIYGYLDKEREINIGICFSIFSDVVCLCFGEKGFVFYVFLCLLLYV